MQGFQWSLYGVCEELTLRHRDLRIHAQKRLRLLTLPFARNKDAPPFLLARKKVAPKKGTQVALLVCSARSFSVRLENSPFGQMNLARLEQFETHNPRTRSQPGKCPTGTKNQLKEKAPLPVTVSSSVHLWLPVFPSLHTLRDTMPLTCPALRPLRQLSPVLH